MCVYVCVYVCVCVCVCVRERERERVCVCDIGCMYDCITSTYRVFITFSEKFFRLG